MYILYRYYKQDTMQDTNLTDDQPIVLTTIENRIATITLNRPHRRNALNGELIEVLDEAVQQVADNPDAKVVILTGAAGDGQHGGFCAGGDIKDGGQKNRDPNLPMGADASKAADDPSKYDLHAPMLLHMMQKPTIAMVGGPAIGAGCSLAAACDLRYCSENAVFASNFSANGLSGDYGGSIFWTRLIGTSRTRELYYLNDKIDARKALAWGMVNDVLPAAELANHVRAIAERLLRVSGPLLANIKDNLNQAEQETDRRRYLFDLETRNQASSVTEIRERMRRKAKTSS